MNPNPNNYASLEASKRLIEAGIVLETKIVHYHDPISGEWKLSCIDLLYVGVANFPAPSMAEVWRELPWHIDNYGELMITGGSIPGTLYCGYRKGLSSREPLFVNYDNPTDALIDLLIWVRKEKGNER